MIEFRGASRYYDARYRAVFDGFSIGSNDLTPVSNRDSSLIAHVFGERRRSGAPFGKSDSLSKMRTRRSLSSRKRESERVRPGRSRGVPRPRRARVRLVSSCAA
jgi:hypothetical protein